VSAPNVTPRPWPPFRIGIISREDYEHARVCVNWLAGVPTERMQGSLIADLLTVDAENDDLKEKLLDREVGLTAQADQIKALTAQRDELVAALMTYITVLSDAGPKDQTSLMAAIRAADDHARELIA
jgi:hypothetical protein